MNIENSLKKLDLSNHNIGTSTGSNYFSNGDPISSFSPVDGLWSVVHQQPRSIFLTITYAMD